MKGILKKALATVILAILIIMSCCQTVFLLFGQITYAADNTNTSSDDMWLYDVIEVYNAGDKRMIPYTVNGNIFYSYSRTKDERNKSEYKYDRYCLNGGVHVNDHLEDENGHWYAEYTSAKDLNNISYDYKIDDRYLFKGKNSSERKNSYEAVKWLAKNIFPNNTYNGKWDRDEFKTYLTTIIKKYANDSYKNETAWEMYESYIQVIQQYALWHFINNKKEEYNPSNENFIDTIKYNGGKQLKSELYPKGKALYTALINAANRRDSGYSLDLTDYKISMSKGSNAIIENTNNTSTQYNYKYGPITIKLINESTNATVNDKNKIKTITGSFKNINATIDSYVDSNGNTISADRLIDVVNENNVYVKFHTSSAIKGVVEYKVKATFIDKLTEYTATLYTKDRDHQPILEIRKDINVDGDSSNVSINFDLPNADFDVALIKQIAQIYRFDGQKWLRVFDSTRTKNQDTGKDKFSDIVYGKRFISYVKDRDLNKDISTNKYIMDKTPIEVMPGDVIRYELRVYNEGGYIANIGELTDYLPEGLRFLEVDKNKNAENYNKYNRTYRDNFSIQTDSSSNVQKVKITTNSNGNNNMVNNIVTPGNNHSYYVECYVSEEAKAGSVLLNAAEITKYQIYDPNNVYTKENTPDCDSNENDIFTNSKLSDYTENINKTITDLKNVDERKDLKQDDEDFEQIKIKNFDMALRKSIYSITTDGQTTEPNRLPNKYEYSKYSMENDTTQIGYYHKKMPLSVKDGSIIRYKIRVYNEGYIPGYAKKITDYLPAGLTYIEDNNINRQYGWRLTKNADNTSTVETSYLANDQIAPANGKTGFKRLSSDGESAFNNNDKFWREIEIVCRVEVEKMSETSNGILTNMAEITNYGYNVLKNNTTTSEFVYKEDCDVDSKGGTLKADLEDSDVPATCEGYFEKNNKILNRSLIYGIEDDDDFENVKIENFDLALRKFIVKIGDEEITNRIPKFNGDSLEALEEEGTAKYFHPKNAVQVETGEKVIYTIRVFNEGNIDGYAREITDYLPKGLEFVPTNESEINRNNGWIATDNSDGSTTIKTEALKNNIIKASNGRTRYALLNRLGYSEYERLHSDYIFWKDVQVECRVTSIVNGLVLRNVAEITQYGYDSNGTFIEANRTNIDIDSQENNVFNTSNINEELKNYIARYEDEFYSPGKQDDDDHEAIKVISSLSYSLKLTKKDTSGNALSGSKFSIKEYLRLTTNSRPQKKENPQSIEDAGIFVKQSEKSLVDNEVINGEKTIETNEILANRDYYYAVTEESSADGYDNILEGYTILIPAYIDENNNINLNTRENDLLPGEYDSSRGFMLFDNDFNIVDRSNELYSKVSVNLNQNSKLIEIEVQNEKIPEGNYQFRIIKKDNNGKKLGGFKFGYKLNDGEERNLTTSNVYGYKTSEKISISSEGTDSIEIREITDSEKYIELNETLKLNVTKALNSTSNNYYVSNIAFENGTSGETEAQVTATLRDETTVTVTAKLYGSRIDITIINNEIEGAYSLDILKIGETETTKLEGVIFNVEDSSGNRLIENSATNENGILSVINNKEIKGIETDKYTIIEENVGENAYIGLENPLDIFVKTKIENNKYVVESVSFSETEVNQTVDVSLKNGNTREAKIELNEGKITVTIPNEESKGYYYFKIRKVDNEDEPITGVKFSVKQNDIELDKSYPSNKLTNSRGRVQFNNIDENIKLNNEEINVTKVISKDNVNEQDKYEITEVDLGRNEYVKLKKSVFVYVKKEPINNIYRVKSVSFDENDENRNTINAELDNDDEVELDASIVRTSDIAAVILVTIPNKPITGSYDLELLKTKEDGRTPLPGVKFTVTKGEGDSVTTLVDKELTDDNGKISIAENVEINSENVSTKDVYTIKENLRIAGYLSIVNDLKVYVKKDIVNNEYKAVNVSFDAEDETKNEADVELKDGTKLKAHATINNGKVIITIPNKEIEGSYGLEIIKTGEGNTKLEGVQFKVTEGEAKREIKNAATGNDGKLTVFTGRTINHGNVGIKEMFTITEIETNDNYLVLPEELNIYVSKTVNENVTEYVVKNASFEKDSVVTSKEVTLANGKVMLVTLENTENLVTVTIPNKEIEGKYSLEILKTGEGNRPLTGVEFKVVEGDPEDNSDQNEDVQTYTTGDDGKVTIFKDRKITSETVAEQDIFTFTEVKTNNSYVSLKDSLAIYVNKDKSTDGKEYVVTTASFEKDEEVTTKNITLANGTEITVSLNVSGNLVTLTIPNNKIEGKYDFELLKTEIFEGAIEGVTFDVKTMKGTEEVKLYDVSGKEINTKGLTTNKDGKIAISNVKITEGAKYNFEITETKVPEGFVMLKDKINLSFNTKVDAKTQTYVLDDVKLTGEAEFNVSSNKITVKVQNGQFDLALRKYISGVTVRVGEKDEKTVQIPNRVPVFKVDENGKYTYEHSKDTVLLGSQNVVEYTLRVYNEGSISGYAKEIKDDIPEGLEFLPENSTNKKYGWKLLDEEGNEVKEVNKAKYIVTNYLSKENEENENDNLIKAFNTKEFKEGKIKEPDYKEVKVAFKVTMPNTEDKVIINKAQISDDSDEKGDPVIDKDSTPDKWIDGEDDQDIEKVKVQYFDLALRKWVTKAIVIEDGKQTVTETGHKAEDDPEEIVKVDLKDSKIDKVVVKFEYKIRVTNEGQIAGYAKEISDYIPQGLKFDAADNPNWKEAEGKIVTEELKDKLLKPGESAEVSVILTWINRKDNLGLKQNVAEISKDYNQYGTPDIDSTPNNKVPGEDDIDDAPVMLTVKTGEAVTYLGLVIAVIVMLGSGTVLIKKYVLK